MPRGLTKDGGYELVSPISFDSLTQKRNGHLLIPAREVEMLSGFPTGPEIIEHL